MNIYRCVSEVMMSHPYDPYEAPEPYAIVELVAAETPGAARWMAWKTDGGFTGQARDMPKFRVVRTRCGVGLPRGIITNWREAWWWTRDELLIARQVMRDSRKEVPCTVTR